jgi:hypothetical protein
MQEEQKRFIANLIKRLGNEDWDKWLREENKSMDSLKTPSDDEFHNNLLKKIEHEMDKLKDE